MSFEKLIRIPVERIGVIIGKSGNTKRQIEKKCHIDLNIDIHVDISMTIYIHCDMNIHVDINTNNTNTIAWYMHQWTTPETPWIVSELQGSDVYRLFKFVSIEYFQSKASSILDKSFNTSMTELYLSES